jgi:glycosyltransferase involved in cell wall biosynthesis
MHLYYSVVDPYPAYRADVAELFAVELYKLGLKTEWFMSPGNKQVGKADVFANQIVHLPIALKSSFVILNKINYWISDSTRLITLLWRPVDAIQCRDKYWGSMVGLFIARIRGIPFFYWCSYPFPEHDAISADSHKGFRRTLGKIKAATRFFLLYRWICRRADHVFVQSERMKLDMHTYGIPLVRMTPVPMGVSAGIFDWTTKHKIPVIPNRIVYLGTLAAVRKLDMLLDAFFLVKQSLPTAKLIFVGDGDVPNERQVLVDRAVALGLDSDIVFTGFLPMEEAWTLSASAAVCLSPFYPTPVLASTSPTKLVEYLALGRPVVCNDHPEQSQIIAESGAGLCVEWSARAFSKAIVQLLREPVSAEIMAKLGPAWVAKHRTYPTIAKAIWLKYQSLVQQTRV